MLKVLLGATVALSFAPVEYTERTEQPITRGQKSYPVVQMHGMGDFAKNPLGMLPFKFRISRRLNGTYVTNAQLGATIVEDELNGFLMNMDDQIDYFKNVVGNDTNLKNGFNAIGYSQGNLVIRGYIERYNDPPVRHFVSMHGPMMGVASLPHCNMTASKFCELIDEMLIGHAVYDKFIQDHLAQANYYRDPMKLDTYRKSARFLPDLNGEADGKTIPASYATNLNSLQKLVLVKAEADTMVMPNDSEWYGFFEDGSTSKRYYDYKQTPWYTDNWFGLKDLDVAGKIEKYSTPGDHLKFTEQFLDKMVDTYFVDPLNAAE